MPLGKYTVLFDATAPDDSDATRNQLLAGLGVIDTDHVEDRVDDADCSATGTGVKPNAEGSKATDSWDPTANRWQAMARNHSQIAICCRRH